MLRQLYDYLIHQPRFRKTAMTMPGVRQLAWRFVAGEDLDAGVRALRSLNARGIRGSLNFVGTHVRNRAEALAAADEAIKALQCVHEEHLDSNLSVKPTQIGLDIDDYFCRDQYRRVLEFACSLGSFVWIDMEEARYVEPTLQLFEELRAEFGPHAVGIVIQSYLRDRAGDLKRVIDGGSSVRLVKGGYWEPEVTYQHKAEIDRCFDRDIKVLLSSGQFTAIATHDERFIARTKAVAADSGLDRHEFEFQMLYGVRQDLQERLVREGYKVRCYVPYGGQYFPYILGCVRRLPGGVLQRFKHRFRGDSELQADLAIPFRRR